MINRVSNRNLLVIEDDQEVCRDLAEYFSRRENAVTVANTLADGIKLLSKSNFDAVILDLLLPDGEGTDLFNAKTVLPPVIILSTLGDERNVLDGFSLGACDYVVKPCALEILEARLSLRLLPKADSEVRVHGLTANANTRTVSYKGKNIAMTSSEFNILWFLMNHSDKFFNADEIYENIWGKPSLNQTSIRCHISHLRNKLLDNVNENLIVTEFGKGYKFLGE